MCGITTQRSFAFCAVGRGDTPTLQTTIRSDQIAWLQAGQSVACDAYLLLMEQLRMSLNQKLYLGLEEYESHFSLSARRFVQQTPGPLS
jgi:SM-20-related protein